MKTIVQLTYCVTLYTRLAGPGLFYPQLTVNGCYLDTSEEKDEGDKMSRMTQFFDSLDEKTPNSVKNIAEFLANLITIFSAVGGVFAVYTVTTPSQGSSTNDKTIYVIVVIVLSLSLLSVLYRAVRSDKRRLSERKLCSAEYYHFLHEYRNQINDLERTYKQNSLTDELLVVTVTNLLEKALDNLSRIFSCMTGYDVSACIKIIVGGGFEQITYSEAYVKTFVRSSNTISTRKSMDEVGTATVRICDNTDFASIVSDDREGNDSVFYQPDLQAYNKELRQLGKQYKNTTQMWEQYYIGTVVVPIRIANKRLFYTDVNDSYNILGFLCVDSLSNKAFSLKQKENYVHIVKSFSALIYNVLSKYQFYLKQITTQPNSLGAMCETPLSTSRAGNAYNNGKNKNGRRGGRKR